MRSEPEGPLPDLAALNPGLLRPVQIEKAATDTVRLFRVEVWGIKHRDEDSVLGRPGSDLLFRVLRLSTIGAGEFNGRVRDGIGYWLPAKATRPAKDGCQRTEDRRQRTDMSFLLSAPRSKLENGGTQERRPSG